MKVLKFLAPLTRTIYHKPKSRLNLTTAVVDDNLFLKGGVKLPGVHLRLMKGKVQQKVDQRQTHIWHYNFSPLNKHIFS